MTGGRLKRLHKYLKDESEFFFTYGDGLADINIASLLDFHRGHEKLATVTAVRPQSRFGTLELDDSRVDHFVEKPVEEGGYINGGFFVLSPKVIDYILDDTTVWENEPMEKLAKIGELMAYTHLGFWQPMDTLREKNILNQLWSNNNAPWKIW